MQATHPNTGCFIALHAHSPSDCRTSRARHGWPAPMQELLTLHTTGATCHRAPSCCRRSRHRPGLAKIQGINPDGLASKLIYSVKTIDTNFLSWGAVDS